MRQEKPMNGPLLDKKWQISKLNLANIPLHFPLSIPCLISEILWNKPLLEELKSHQFDVAITEIFDMCPYAMFHAIGVRTKLAAMALPWLHVSARRFGIPTFSSYVPSKFTFSSFNFSQYVRIRFGPKFIFILRFICHAYPPQIPDFAS
jgi:hypothetical protein